MALSSCSFWWDLAWTLSIRSFSTDKWSIWRMCEREKNKISIFYGKSWKIFYTNIHTFIALSINLESQDGRGGSCDICSGFDPSPSSILIVTLYTDAAPVFLPKTCWLKDMKKENFENTFHCEHSFISLYYFFYFILGRWAKYKLNIILPNRKYQVFCWDVSLFLHQVSPSLSNQH